MVVRRGPRGPTRGGSRGTVADSPADTVEDVSGTGGGDLALDWLAGRRRVPLVWTRSGGSDTYFRVFWFSFDFCLCLGCVLSSVFIEFLRPRPGPDSGPRTPCLQAH